MRRLSWFQIFAYLAVAFVAIGLAFATSLRFLRHSYSQDNAPLPTQMPTPAPNAAAPPPAAPAPPAPAAPAAPLTTTPPPTAGTAPSSPPPPSPNTPPPVGAAAGRPNVPAQESAAAVAAEVQGFLEPFIYDAKNRRDPFQPYADFRPVDTQLMLSPLQRYDLDELKLVGIMWDVHSPKAMFIDPDKQVHVVGRDESIGKKNGYIATIREGEVVVVESVRKDGEVVFKPRVLRMER